MTRLNVDIADWEQRRDERAIANLDRTISAALLFRRADGSVVGKTEFMDGLKKPSPFVARESVDVTATIRGDRALVTLYVDVTRADGSKSRFRNVRVFAAQGSGWQLDFWFNDAVDQPI